MNKKLSAKTVYYIYSGATSLFFTLVFTVSSVYRIEIVKLNPLELVLVGTVLETACFILEIPTGVVADIYSRKLSVIIGVILIGFGFLLEGSVPIFAAVLAAQVLWGAGATFLSGADDAWIADEVGQEKLDHIYIRGTQVNQLCSLAGIILGALLGNISLSFPIILGGSLFIGFSVFLIFFMPENGFAPVSMEDKNSWQKMWHTFRSGMQFIMKRPVLLGILGIALLYGLYSEGFDRLWTAHFLQDTVFPAIGNFKLVTWFGIINGCAMILSIVVVEIIKRYSERTGKLDKVWILMIINMFYTASIILFGFSGNFTAMLMTYWSSYILRMANDPLYRAWINSNVESNVRATVLSVVGQIDALGQIIGGPIIGVVANSMSISKAIVFAGIILSPVILLYLYRGIRQRRSGG